ncbi:unnamed protein product [Allacma fusca]|uniref:Uncharacterized protein n=1 Tax=Allacma fusca TaxID=39272 RepID=A0A8J2LDL4_9HEXA|nr:unnamed protein product [Allacma fusca]
MKGNQFCGKNTQARIYKMSGLRVVVELAHASTRGRGGGPASSRGFRDRRTPTAGGPHARSGGDRGAGDRDSGRKKVIVERARGVPRDGRGRSSRRGPPRGSDKYGPPTRTEYRLIVENLSSRVSWQPGRSDDEMMENDDGPIHSLLPWLVPMAKMMV